MISGGSHVLGGREAEQHASAISRSVCSTLIPSTSRQISRVSRPGSGAGRCGAGGMWRKGAGPVSAGRGRSISGCAMSLIHFSLDQLRIRQDVRRPVHRPGGNPAGLHLLRGPGRAAAAGPVRHQRDQLPAVGHPRRTGGEARIVDRSMSENLLAAQRQSSSERTEMTHHSSSPAHGYTACTRRRRGRRRRRPRARRCDHTACRVG